MAYIRLDPPQSTPGPSSNPEASTHLTPFDRGTRAIGKALPAHLSPEIQARGLAAARRPISTKPCSVKTHVIRSFSVAC